MLRFDSRTGKRPISVRHLAPAGDINNINQTENIQGPVPQVPRIESSVAPSLEFSDQVVTLEVPEALETGAEALSEIVNPRVEPNPTPTKTERSTYFRTREYNLRSGKK